MRNGRKGEKREMDEQQTRPLFRFSRDIKLKLLVSLVLFACRTQTYDPMGHDGIKGQLYGSRFHGCVPLKFQCDHPHLKKSAVPQFPPRVLRLMVFIACGNKFREFFSTQGNGQVSWKLFNQSFVEEFFFFFFWDEMTRTSLDIFY